VTAHDFEHESPGVRACSGADIVDGLADTVKSRRCADSQIGHGHIIVNRADQTSDPQMSIEIEVLLCNQTYNMVIFLAS
jgi:hypothetical protein